MTSLRPLLSPLGRQTAAALLLSPCLLTTRAAGQSFASVDAAVQDGIARGIYPGAVVLIGRKDTVLYARGYGHLTWQASAPVPSPDSTLWDLASLTKVVATTSALMLLVERGQVDLDAPLSRYLPRFSGENKGRVTVRMLLDHTSGLPSYVEFFRLAPTRDSAITLLYREPLRRPPGVSAVYSDLNALLLGLLVEGVSGEPLDRFVSREVFAPLGMSQTMFRPSSEMFPRVAPTGSWRGQPVRGVVNDQNAARFGAVAGHAGLFSTATDLARFARMWLNRGAGPPASARLVEPVTIARFLQATPASGTRLLGWDSPDPKADGPTPFGSLLSSSAYGHTGWTGTELWVDPARDVFLIFLTNRSYAPRVSHSISELRAVRARLADATVRAVPDACRAVLTTVNC